MPIKFSEQFNIKQPVIEEMGVFDVILDVDTRVFVDPALLELCLIPEFQGCKEKIENYFSQIITLLSHSKSPLDMYWKRADKMLTFKELTGTCFGYSKDGTDGNAIGKTLRKSILETIKELIDEGKTDPVLFELLGAFQEDIGCDRVSDLITFLLCENILEYSQRIATACNAKKCEVSFNRQKFSILINPHNGKPLLLLPETILSPLPIATDFDDIDRICAENQRVRDAINAYFDFGKKKKVTKSQILSLMHTNTGFCQTMLEAYKSVPKNAYDFSKDKSGEYIWYSAAKKSVEEHPLDLSSIALNDISDVWSVTEKITSQFKTLIEDNALAALLYDSDGNPKKESAAQLLFFGIADSYCTANNIDLTKEGNTGRGPVDFKLSKGALDKVLVETKLTSNSQLKHGIETQLPIYMKQEKTKKALYLIIDTGHQKTLDNFIKFYNNLDVSIKEKIKYIVVDATKKLSASKA